MTVSSINPEHTLASPPRYRRLKRISKSLAVFAAVLVVLFFSWRYEARRRFDAEITKALAEEAPVPVVPDHLNAATYLAAADASIARRGISQPPLSATMVATWRGTRMAPSTAPAMARTARFQPHLVWPRSLPAAPAPHDLTALAYELGSVALHQHANGMDAEAFETLLDIVAATGRHGAPSPGALDLDRTTCVAMQRANEAVYVMVADFAIAPDSDATTRPDGPASRVQVRALIDALLDDSTFEQPYADRLRESRAYAARYFNSTTAIAPGRGMALMLDPFYRLEAVRLMRDFNHSADVVAAANQTALLRNPASPRGMPRPSLFESIVHPFGSDVIGQIVSMHYEALSDRRVCALILAMRLYMADHQGQLPPTLDALAPSYVAKLPEDPFSPAKQPFLYTTTPEPALASVGYDGQDDGMIRKTRARLTSGLNELSERQRWFDSDAIYVLPFKPPPAATED
jgi:hypothetical protein